MACATRSPKFKQIGERVQVAGTWDFKWPLDTNIRVLFQAPLGAPQNEVREAIVEIARIAELWIRALKAAKARLHLTLVTDQVLAPIRRGDRSNLNRSPLAASMTQCDVVVSLERLTDLARRDPRNLDVAEDIRLPISDLGSYARRADAAAPSAYLGPFGRPQDESIADFYREKIGRFAVLHGFGHILGLPHAHQNPRVQQPHFRQDAAAIVERRLGVDVPDAFAEEYFREQIELRWPGNPVFSDWPEVDGTEASSVMSAPYFDCLIEGKHHACTAAGCASFQTRLAELADKGPTETDVSWLELMYCPRAREDAKVEREPPDENSGTTPVVPPRAPGESPPTAAVPASAATKA